MARTGIARAAQAALLLGLLSACSEGPGDAFEREALPVLEGRCLNGACHGVAPGQTPAMEGYLVPVDAEGRVRDVEQARTLTLERVTTSAPLLSSLLREPMPIWAGGVSHGGGDLFQRPTDPAAQALLRWVSAEQAGSGGEDLALTELETLFQDTVLPHLVERCGRGGCHGPNDSAATAFAAVLEPGTGSFAPLAVRASYGAARKHLDLWSDDPARSRLIRKAIGSADGGLVHRGGGDTLFSESEPGQPEQAPGIEAILEWARAERQALGTAARVEPSALVFVVGPVAPRLPFRIGAGTPGSDLYVTDWPVEAGAERNLTAKLHPEGPAVVRDPALSHDASRVVFAMRRAGEMRFSLWEIELATEQARQLPMQEPGSLVQAQYTPEGRLVAVWDGHGDFSEDGPGVAPELVAVDSEGALERLTYTPAPEVSPSFLSTGKTRGELLFSTRRQGAGGPQGVMFRFPMCHDPDKHGDPEYHVHFGASIKPLCPLAARDLPDGRQVMIALEHADVLDDRGRLGLLDRSLGPALGVDQDTSLGGYQQPISWLSLEPRFRDPAVLPDGRVLVAADSAEHPGRDTLYLATVEDGPAGVRLAGLDPLWGHVTQSARSPLPVFARPPEDDPHEPVIEPGAPRGYLALRDVAVLEALYGRAEPTGARALLGGIVGVRVLGRDAVGVEGIRRHDDGGTTLGLSAAGPLRILDEIQLPADRSAWLDVPARTPLQLRWLDSRGMTIGNQLDRWYYTRGEETVPGGTNGATYSHACSACHGAMSGRPEEAATRPPDAVSSASVTLSTHEQRNPREPLEPRVVGSESPQVDYVHGLAQPLERSCGTADCHGGTSPAAAIALDDHSMQGRFSVAYTSLTTLAVDLEGLRARSSVLVERLTGEELDAPGAVTGRCPPDGVDPELLSTVVRWIETGAAYDLSAREPAHD